MSLWIRSQDKEILVECDKLEIEEKNYWKKISKVYVLNEDDELNIYWDIIIKANDIIIGIYSTKEKALKVLDMIQREINNEYIRDYMVFQMPLDESL